MQCGQMLMRNLQRFYVKNNILIWYIMGGCFLLGAALLGMLSGSTYVPVGEFFKTVISGNTSSSYGKIILFVRLPRTVAAILSGSALAVSGAVLQSVLNNRLASPGIIGINSGAGLLITLCAAFGIYGGWQLSLFSFLGAFLSAVVISLGAKKYNASKGTVILIGVALNSLLNALADGVNVFFKDAAVLSHEFKVGDFSGVTLKATIYPAIFILIAIVLLVSLSKELEILSMGEDCAKSLGVNTKTMRVTFLMLSALLASSAVSMAGLLSFAGLIVPHIIKGFSGKKSVHHMALCALYGGGFVCLCDTVSRVVFAPFEIPVGIVMSVIGVPFFVYIILKKKERKIYD